MSHALQHPRSLNTIDVQTLVIQILELQEET